MISPELFITQLTDENAKLKGELEQAKKDIRDFEILAIEWKRGFDQMKRKLENNISHLEQIIEELDVEHKEYKRKHPDRE